MPLRDHFRPPVWKLVSWEGFHGGWPMTIVQRLLPKLPQQYTAEPRVHLGKFFEIDVCAFEGEEPELPQVSTSEEPGGVATATLAPPRPTFTVDADLSSEYAYEVLVFDHDRQRQLVAAVEIVSPGNKDRKASRRAFVAKCAALLQQGVCLSIVDIVTIRRFNLYAELLAFMELTDPAFSPQPPPVYAVTCRGHNVDDTGRFQSWAYPLAIGQPLSDLPIWLSEDDYVMLELEASYEDACRVFRIN
jgi:hypothetical protein